MQGADQPDACVFHLENAVFWGRMPPGRPRRDRRLLDSFIGIIRRRRAHAFFGCQLSENTQLGSSRQQAVFSDKRVLPGFVSSTCRGGASDRYLPFETRRRDSCAKCRPCWRPIYMDIVILAMEERGSICNSARRRLPRPAAECLGLSATLPRRHAQRLSLRGAVRATIDAFMKLNCYFHSISSARSSPPAAAPPAASRIIIAEKPSCAMRPRCDPSAKSR
ncbi:hypothetical protein ShzoTeo12_53680 (plasmid) [Shinella zoogloeoides]|nr:hypothetical protein ShzoTeo12_53680 [Shinella zoogloeoides]